MAKHDKDDNEGQETFDVRSFVHRRDIEHEITFSLIFNWFIGWPVLVLLFTFLTITISRHYVTDAFIDEKFHIPQTVQYFNGDFKTWNSKITTPPGLYYLGYIFTKLFQFLRLPIDPTSPLALRLVNTFGGTIFLPLALNPLFKLNPLQFWSTTILLCPLLTIFYTLYYTDVWSAVMVITSFSIAMTSPFGEKRSVLVSALFGALSVLFRQTNIIWNIFILVTVIERRAIIQKNFTDSFLNNCIKFLLQFFEDFTSFSLPYITNVMLFVAFVVYNRGITLGDKENHLASFHFAQLFYCAVFLMILTWPLWISDISIASYLRRYKYGRIIVLIEFAVLALFIRFSTVVHPFLLADNRHYTFYIWRKIINSTRFSKYLLIPIYHFAIYINIEQLSGNRFLFSSTIPTPFKSTTELPLKPTGISITAFLICTIFTIVPSPLFEPRYYILPYIFFRLFIEVPFIPFFSAEPTAEITLRRLSLELSFFVVFNLVIFWIYLFYTFTWEGESSLQRIIW